MERMEDKKKELISQKPNLYLLGFMGTGKTTLGRRLASILNFKFLDSDLEIEKKCAMSVSDIFKKYGEEYFRSLERDFIENGHPPYGCVVACGGGLVCRDGMPELVKSKGVCVVLFSKADEILERVSKNKNRPLLDVENQLERIKELIAMRTPYYMRSGVAIVADPNIKVSEEHILRIYRNKTKKLQEPKQASKT